MPLTLWILGLAALAAAVFWLYRKRERSRHDAKVAIARRKSAAEQAANDRRDCKALEESLLVGAYGDRSRSDSDPTEP